MINLTCTYCGERMEFHAVLTHFASPVPGSYKMNCVDAGSQCPTFSIYKKLPGSIHANQKKRFIDNLNRKSVAKEREWKKSIEVERFREDLEKNLFDKPTF